MKSASTVSDRQMSFVPWMFPLGLGLVIAVNMVLLWFALTTFPGTVTRNAYEEGRNYDRILDYEALRARLGWAVEIAFVDEASGTIEVRYRDRAGMPIEGLQPKVVASRPVGDRISFEASLQPVGPGIYRGTLALPLRGVWDLRLSSEHVDGRHHSVSRVTLR